MALSVWRSPFVVVPSSMIELSVLVRACTALDHGS
jgi:hypothetical protein